MNVAQYDRWKSEKDNLANLGLEGVRQAHLLSGLTLKTIVRESHGEAVSALVFNHTEDNATNLFATSGKDQVTLYDDDYLAGHVSIVAHFVNKQTEHAPGGVVRTASFIRSAGATQHPGDCWLAFGGKDCCISVISMAESCVRYLLRGHERELRDLAGSTGAGGLLASLDEGGTVMLWMIPSRQAVCALRTDGAACLAVDHLGQVLYVGGKKGEIFAYPISKFTQRKTKRKADDAEARAGAGAGPVSAAEAAAAGAAVPRVRVDPSEGGHSAAIDCMRALSDGRLITKSADGRVCVWRPAASASELADPQSTATRNLKLELGFKVPNCRPTGTRSSFGTTKDGAYLAVGNDEGQSFIFELATGERKLSLASTGKGGKVVACALSEDLAHLHVAMGQGYVFRFEAKPIGSDPEAEAEEKLEEDEGAGPGPAGAATPVPLASDLPSGLSGLLGGGDGLPSVSPLGQLFPNLQGGAAAMISPATEAIFRGGAGGLRLGDDEDEDML